MYCGTSILSRSGARGLNYTSNNRSALGYNSKLIRVVEWRKTYRCVDYGDEHAVRKT